MPRASETLKTRYNEACKELRDSFGGIETRIEGGGASMSGEEKTEIEKRSAHLEMRKLDYETQLQIEQLADGAITSGGVARTAEGTIVSPEIGGVSALEAIGEAVKTQIQRQPMPGNLTELWSTLGFDSVLSEFGNVMLPPALIDAARKERAARAQGQQTRTATGTGQIANRATLEYVSPFVRAMSVVGSLGVMPTGVPEGKVRFGWIDTSPNASAKVEDPSLAQVAEEQVTIEQQELAPVRILSPRGMTYEAASTYGMLGEMLLADSFDAVRDQIEALVINGDGSAPNFHGLFGRAGAGRAAPAAVDTWKSVVEAFESQVDGTYAADMSDLRCIMVKETHAWLSSLTPSASGELTATRYLSDEMASMKVSGHAKGRTSSNKIHHVLVRRGMLEGAYAWPNWRTEVGIDQSSALGVGARLSVWDLCNFFVPVQADHARNDFVVVQLRQTA